jgi:hypothetical protein
MQEGRRRVTRLTSAWRALQREQRYAALAALGLFLSMFLHWYSKTETRVVGTALKPAQINLTAFQDFSFVEAAVLLVSAGLLAMLFARAERRRFQLPGGDGLIVMIAGGWSALLIFYRLLDKPGVQSNHRGTATATVGVEWGIFIALLVALGLLYAGVRMRAAERLAQFSARPAPAGEDDGGSRYEPLDEHAAPYAGSDAEASAAAAVVRARSGPQTAASAFGERDAPRRRPRYPPAPGDQQMSLEDASNDAAP